MGLTPGTLLLGLACLFVLLVSAGLWWGSGQDAPLLSLSIGVGYTVNKSHRLPEEARLTGVYRMEVERVVQQQVEGETPPYTSDADMQCDVSNSARMDCHPGTGASATSCQARGCCWNPPSSTDKRLGDLNIPYCYFPRDYPSYIIQSQQVTPNGYSLNLVRQKSSPWPHDVTNLRLDVTMETDTRLRFKFYDPGSKRYEVPIELHKQPTSKQRAGQYYINFRGSPFGITIARVSTGAVVFDTTSVNAPLIFADQFLQFSTALTSDPLYGLGEHRGPLALNASSGWSLLSFWARDTPPSTAGGTNLYGVHPFYIQLESEQNSGSNAHGVLLLNSNAMEVDLTPLPALTYRTIGGILDFYLFLGSSPDDVIQQYTQLVGLPYLPPYWSLGFQLCKYGYGSSDEVKKVIARNRALSIPYESQWTDIDYMDQYRDWTYDPKNFADLPAVVEDLHAHNQHYVIIVDPGISNTIPGKYLPYDEGMKRDIFIKNMSGNPLVGKVWPGNTLFPDWSHPNVTDWWYDSAKTLYDQLPFDGLWTDMDEPSNFGLGSIDGCPPSNLDNPPYTPAILEGKLPAKTICASAKQYLGSHYDLHSLYGHMETKATLQVLERLRPSHRGFVLTRSTFVGGGQYAAHWSGDNSAKWDDLYFSIPEMLEFQMFGIPMIGADICGFGGTTTQELCTRWMQLGAFYPFMRNHNAINSPDQDPGVWSADAQAAMKSALEVRYTLLPTLYSLIFQSHLVGSPVTRPLVFQYPEDPVTFNIDRQFLWGSYLLISPVLEEGATSVSAYFPADTWYDYYTGAPLTSTGQWITLDAPLDKINLHVRGGSIFITQPPDGATVVKETRTKPFGMVVALDGETVEGNFYWDDGETTGTVVEKKYTWISMAVDTKENILICAPKLSGYKPDGGLVLTTVRVLGMIGQPSKVNIDSKQVQFSFNSQTKELQVFGFTVDLLDGMQMEWI